MEMKACRISIIITSLIIIKKLRTVIVPLLHYFDKYLIYKIK